jgi:pSer/pThr/pTyr-binding forkhead associated (FHA) protein
MKLLSHYAAACKSLPREAFVQRHPGPFLVHSSRTGGVLQAGAGGRTFDSVVVDDSAPDDVPDEVRTVFTVSQFSTKGPDVSIGSELGTALRVPAASVSRSHAVLHLEGGRWLIEDSGSSMGTWVNGEVVEPGARRPLSPGDRLSLGAVDVTFLPAAQFYDFVRQIVD